MVNNISQGSGGNMFDLVGMAQNNMSLLKSQRESRRVNAGGITCETTIDPKYMLGALASKQSTNMLSNLTEKTNLQASDAALEKNKKYIEDKAQEALAPDTKGTITDQLLEESTKDGEVQTETTGSDLATSPDTVSPAPDSAASPALESTAPVANKTKQSVDITV